MKNLNLIILIFAAVGSLESCHFQEELKPISQTLNTKTSWPPYLLSEEKKSEFRKKLENRRDAIKPWAPTCDISTSHPQTLTGPEYPGNNGSYSGQMAEHSIKSTDANGAIIWNTCAQWDTNDEGGTVCLAAFLAGDDDTFEYRCRDIKLAQTPDGRWFRGYTRIAIEKWMCENNFHAPDGEFKGVLQCPESEAFSRDALEGTIGYWIATKDAESARRWMQWIRKINVDSPPGEFHMCKNYSPKTNICLITPGTWGELGKIWQHLGLPLEPEMIKYSNTTAGTIFSSLGARIVEFSLTANEIWMRRVLQKISGIEVNEAEARAFQSVAESEANRYPINPYLYYLNHGVDDELVSRILKYCPANRPNYDQIFKPYTEAFPVPIPAWSWSREDQYEPWLYASGHDCIFLIDVALGDMNLW